MIGSLQLMAVTVHLYICLCACLFTALGSLQLVGESSEVRNEAGLLLDGLQAAEALLARAAGAGRPFHNQLLHW